MKIREKQTNDDIFADTSNPGFGLVLSWLFLTLQLSNAACLMVKYCPIFILATTMHTRTTYLLVTLVMVGKLFGEFYVARTSKKSRTLPHL